MLLGVASQPLSMKILSLVRHTRPNISVGICYGQLDIEVADNFAASASEIRQLLQTADSVVTSPLLRARVLADYLATEWKCDCRIDTRLQEMHFGTWEGGSWDDIPRHALDTWSADLLNFCPPGGESAGQMLDRVDLALSELLALPQQHTVVVAHAGTIRAILALLSDQSLEHIMRWQLDYGAVVQVKLNE